MNLDPLITWLKQYLTMPMIFAVMASTFMPNAGAVLLGGILQNKLSAADKRNLISRLGRERDVDLAREFGLTRTRIGQMRTERSIPRFNKNIHHTAATRLTSADIKRTKQAIKKSGTASQSEYIRTAIKDKNKEVLG